MRDQRVRICGWCGKPLDKRSEELLKKAPPDRHLVSHGICDKCLEKVEKDIVTALLMVVPHALLGALL